MLTPIDVPRAFAVDEIDAKGRLNRRIKVFEEGERRQAVLLTYRLNNPYRNGSTCPPNCEVHRT